MATKWYATKQQLDHWRNQRRNKKYLETNKNTVVQNVWDAAKAVLRGKFIVIKSYLKKQEKSQTT